MQGGGNRNTAIEMQRLMDQYGRLLDQMERDYTDDAGLRYTVETARRAGIPRITGELLDEAAQEHFKQSVFNPLAQLEAELLKRLDALDMDRKLASMRKSEVPPEYRTLVEKYFESISKTGE